MSVDWATISSLATAAGTLVLAVATFAAVRSANQAARTAEHSLLAALRPLFVPSRLQDEPQKVLFADAKWLRVPGGCAAIEAENGVIYLTASLRNVGSGIGIVRGWIYYPDWDPARPRPELKKFHPRPVTSTCRPATSASGRPRSATPRTRFTARHAKRCSPSPR